MTPESRALPPLEDELPASYRPAGMLYKLKGERRQQALEGAGPTWREWFFSSFASVWLALAYLVFDIWVLLLWLDPSHPEAVSAPAAAGIIASLVLLAYLEVLLWRYLWYNPTRDQDATRRPFRRTWFVPARFGRWTPQYRRLRRGRDPFDETA